MNFNYNDGGRAEAGYKGNAGDCVTRAVAIATGLPYQQVYDSLHQLNKEYAENHRGYISNKIKSGGGKRGTTPRNGIFKPIIKQYLLSLGWIWCPTMQIGQGCKVHLKAEELPQGRIIVSVSKHLVAIIDGTIHDTHDCSREGMRCVYGYYLKTI